MDELKLVYAYDRPREVGELFKEYTDMLIEGDKDFAEYLKIQKYDKELENPASKYGMPEGRLYLAYVGEELAGCVGLKKMEAAGQCELKRMYVRPSFRGNGLGEGILCSHCGSETGGGCSGSDLPHQPLPHAPYRMHRHGK